MIFPVPGQVGVPSQNVVHVEDTFLDKFMPYVLVP